MHFKAKSVQVLISSIVLLLAVVPTKASPTATLMYQLGIPAGIQYYDVEPFGSFNQGQTTGAGMLVGTGNTGHGALFWSATSPGGINLSPVGSNFSYAYGTDGIHQVGSVDNQATIWKGTAASATTLQPLNGAFYSGAYGIAGTQAVGISGGYAVVWNIVSNSVINLGAGIG